jgi:hypothetical protein
VTRSAYLNVDNLFISIANNLDATILLFIVEFPELPLFLPIIEGTDDDYDKNCDHDGNTFDPVCNARVNSNIALRSGEIRTNAGRCARSGDSIIAKHLFGRGTKVRVETER